MIQKMNGTRNSNNGWDAFLFDLDGTLADTVSLILRCYRHTMLAHLGYEPPDDLWRSGIGTPLDVQLTAFARSETELIAMKETYRTFQHTVHDDMVRPFPGVVDLLDRFCREGVPMGVVTSKSREMAVRTMQVCGIAERFEILITPEDVQRSKPDPEPVLAALTRLNGARRQRVLFLGDSPMDVEAGRAAGVRTAGALWGAFPPEALKQAGPDYLLAAFDDLAALSPA